MSVFGCVSDEQFYLEVGSEWPSWACIKDVPKISMEDLRRVFDGKKDMSYREYIKEHYDRQGK